MNMSERPPPKRICPVSRGQSSVRAARMQIPSAAVRGQRGSHGIGSDGTCGPPAHQEKGDSRPQFGDGQQDA